MSEVLRNRWGQPLITPRDGGKPVPYARASSYGDVLEDKTNLNKWVQRMTAKGLANRPDLLLAVAATPLENKTDLNKFAESAVEAAGGTAKATIGTALHSFTEQLDRGEAADHVPHAFLADLVAYRNAVAGFEMEHIERFMVCDEFKIAGTPDRWFWEYLGHEAEEGGEARVLRLGDLKTSSSDLKYQGSKFAVQLAVYAHSDFYDPATGERTPVGAADRARGVIFHMPAGSGKCDLYEVDLVAGWEAVQLAHDVRQWRKRKGLLSPVAA